ncbi:MAG: DUF2723 domain-containing protein, partial [Proteobacteria bacterium]|nr:DUF2723 domain-containing protein [Pseudomonadota bacterium]
MSGKTLIPVVSIFLLTLAAYLLSMPRLITLEDAGLFQMICHGGGIGHPPGYPLFVLGCQAFVGLPFFAADVFAGNLLSALFASLTCVVVFLVARRLNLTATSAAVAAAGYGLSATFWSQAIIIEVYSLAALMFSICLFFALRFQQTGRSTDLYLLGFSYGLALSNHWPIQGLATPALLLVLQPAWRSVIEKLRSPLVLSGILISLIVGLTPYLSLFQAQPRFAVFGGVDSLSEFFRYLSRAAYNDHSAIAGWQDKGLYQAWILRQSALELSFWLLPLVLLGCFSSFRVLGRANALALVLLYLGATTLLILLLGFEFNSFRQAIFRPYPIVAYLALAIWLALGTAAATRFLHNWVQARWIRILVPALVVTVAGISNLPVNYRADAVLADSYGRQVLGMLPPDSILFVEGDNGVGPVGYLHHVEGIRPDIELRSWNNLVFANRLTEPEASDQQQDAARKAFIAQTERPVFSNSRHQDPVLHRGLVYQYGGTGAGCDGSSHDFAYLLLLLEITQA